MGSSTILIADEIHPSGIAILKSHSCTVSEQYSITPDALVASISSYDGLVVRSRTKVTKQIIENGKKLKVIARAGTGVDTIDVEAAKNRGIPVINAKGANAEAVAEHTIGFMLMLARNMAPVASALSAGRWEKKTYTAMELKGKTLGIIGLGAIGSRVAQIAVGLGMTVVVYNRTSDEKSKRVHELGGRLVNLGELLQISDVVSIHVPLTPETKRLLGEKEFSSMKKTAYFINTARGEIVDQQALVKALQDGKIAGAALDVYEEEPLPAGSPLCGLPNILLTPHVASVSREGAARISQMIAEGIISVLQGGAGDRAV
jgi:D-3-phosphoglycerate dehydrogenase / 2-oxoglutarate reductase